MLLEFIPEFMLEMGIQPLDFVNFIHGFGYRFHPILKVRKLHTGLDFGAPMGSPVYATADGIVINASHGANGYGLAVDLQHGFGYETKYAHHGTPGAEPSTAAR